MSTLQIGKPNYNRTNAEKKVFYRLGMKENQRELTLFICPPIKSLAERGQYSVYTKQHFGYSMPGKGDKPFPMVFSCVEERDRNRNITKECPECNEISLRKTAMEAMEVRLKASGTSQELIDAQLRPQKAWLKEHNLDKKYNFIVKNEAGAWGYLALSYTANKDFQRELGDLRAAGIDDPIGSLWFKFTRTGTSFNDVNDTCKAVQIRDGKSFQYKEGTLSTTDLQALEAMDELTTLGRRISYEQIEMLVKSGGAEDVVKSVFSISEKSETSAVRVNPLPSRVELPVTNPVVANLPPAQATQNDLLAQLAAAQEAIQKLSMTQKGTTVATQPSPTMTTKLDMDPDEFMATFGQK